MIYSHKTRTTGDQNVLHTRPCLEFPFANIVTDGVVELLRNRAETVGSGLGVDLVWGHDVCDCCKSAIHRLSKSLFYAVFEDEHNNNLCFLLSAGGDKYGTEQVEGS